MDMYVCMYVEKQYLCRIWYYLQFQAPTRGFGMISPMIGTPDFEMSENSCIGVGSFSLTFCF
jgi:hypothetical protein